MAKLAEHRDRAVELAEVRAIAAGDQRAFAALVDRETPRLLRFARALLGSLEEAEDVVQETLVRLWENAARWTPEARIGTWLHSVAYNASIDRLRRRRNFVDESALDDLPEPGPLPDQGLLSHQAAISVHAAIEQLSHRQRSAVLLFHFQELSQAEAARVMGLSESAFESLLARARRRMRDWLTAQGGNLD